MVLLHFWFKDGLESMQFVTALQQDPEVRASILCHSNVNLSATDMEEMFEP